MIYFTSDLHLCHDRHFVYGARGFDSIYEMNKAIVDNWNSVVQADDDVYVLGDLMLNDNATGLKLLKSLKGKIHIIRGNHDTDERIKKYKDCWNVVEVVDAKFLRLGKRQFFLSHFPCVCRNWEAAVLVINLCGHTHTTDKFSDADKGVVYHVEVDAHNCTPVSLDKILEDIRKYREENFKCTTLS